MGPLLNLRASPAGKGLRQAKGYCGKASTLHSQFGDRYTLQGIFHASILRKKTQKKEKKNHLMLLW